MDLKINDYDFQFMIKLFFIDGVLELYDFVDDQLDVMKRNLEYEQLESCYQSNFRRLNGLYKTFEKECEKLFNDMILDFDYVI